MSAYNDSTCNRKILSSICGREEEEQPAALRQIATSGEQADVNVLNKLLCYLPREPTANYFQIRSLINNSGREKKKVDKTIASL